MPSLEHETVNLPTDPNCYWDGTAPFCMGQCAEGYQVMKEDPEGGGTRCWTGNKVYCCPAVFSSPHLID